MSNNSPDSPFQYYFTFALSILDMIPPLLIWFGQAAVMLLSVCLIIAAFGSLISGSFVALTLQLLAALIAAALYYVLDSINNEPTDNPGRP